MGAQLASAHSALNMKLLVVLALRPSLPLSLKPRQRLLLILTSTATEDTDWDTDTVLEDTTLDTVLATTASVRLRLPPRLRLTPTFCMVVDTMVMDWDTTAWLQGILLRQEGG